MQDLIDFPLARPTVFDRFLPFTTPIPLVCNELCPETDLSYLESTNFKGYTNFTVEKTDFW